MEGSAQKDEANDHTVQTDGFSKNEDKDHADVDAVSLGVGSHSSVASNADGKARG